MNNIYETVAGLQYLKSIRLVIEKAQMVELLKNEGPFTFFVPHNGAFGAFTTYEAEDLLHEYIQADLEKILGSRRSAQETLNYLLLAGRLPLSDLKTRLSVTALDGHDIPIDTTNGESIIVGNAYLLNSDLECTNGIIHVTGELLQPTL